ncbi:NECA3 protein, partial [Aegotheles bennettii]|nr:NECA3 protein [Aegotheles bennettii]
DDGKLSFEEFKNYFADGILSSEELWELFSGIDRRHSDNVDTEKLCAPSRCSSAPPAWSWWHLTGPLPSLQRYETSSKIEQFLTRFLLRETMHQLQSLQASLECAVDTVEEQAGRERKDTKKPEASVGVRSGRRCGRRGQKNICLSPTDPYSGMLTTGTTARPSLGMGAALLAPGLLNQSRSCKAALLQELQRMEDLGPQEPCASTSSHKLWVPQTCVRFLCGAGPWLLHASTQGHSCPRSVSACKLTDEACFILYEFWQDVTSWRSHLQSSCSKTFQRAIISLLESPELLTTMLFPASWWIMNNN